MSAWPVVAASLGELRTVPVPSLESFEPAVREQLGEAQAAVDEGLGSAGDGALRPGSAPAVELADAFGRAGRLYLFYDRADAAEACLVNAATLEPAEFAWHYYLGSLYQDDGRLGAAADSLARALELEPEDLPTLLRLAEVRYRAQEIDASQDLYRRAFELDSESAMVHYGLGRVANSRRDFAAAARHFERALELQPESNTLYHPLGLAYRRLGFSEKAREALRRAGNNAPFFQDPLRQELYVESRTARSYLFEGNRARRRGLTELAITNYRRALELDPTIASVHYNLGVLLGGRGMVDAAEEHFRQAVEHDPEHRDAHFNLGTSLRARGELEQALGHFARVAELDPTDFEARIEEAATRIAAGQGEEGMAALRAVWQRRPEAVDDLILLARYFEQAGRSEQVEAVLAHAESRATTPEERATVFLRRAERARVRFDRRGVESALRAAVAAAPEWPRARLAWAEQLAGAGRYPEAAREFAAVARLDPENPAPVVGEARVWMAMGRFEQARAVLEAALEPPSPENEIPIALIHLLATCPDPRVADAGRALELARALAEKKPGPATLEALAMALASAGRFEEAVGLQEQLLARIGSSPNRDAGVSVDRLRSNLQRYRDGMPALRAF
ncbi:MAG: tetratricopeptide repeat protein [Holophagales bacterium]|nr:tetratricopeptide repeat protein [Holophagales bacterium]